MCKVEVGPKREESLKEGGCEAVLHLGAKKNFEVGLQRISFTFKNGRSSV